MQDLKKWFSQRQIWQQYAAKMTLETGNISGEDIDILAGMCLKEASGLLKAESYAFPDNAFSTDDAGTLHLNAISKVQGINKLSPKKPLSFGASNLSVVYGLNGSGKSGYVRILKQLCGAKNKEPLLANVFDQSSTEHSCQIGYLKDGEPENYKWVKGSGVVDDLRNVDIFDTTCGAIYVSDDNEVTYEPPLLSFFSELIDVFGRVSKSLNDNESKLVSSKPVMPVENYTTSASNWYKGLKATTKEAEVDDECTWSAADNEKLIGIEKRLAQKSPADKAKSLKTQKKHLDDVVRSIESAITSLSDAKCNEILAAKQSARNKRTAAITSAEKIFTGAPLTGVGSDVWIELWEKAKLYSEKHAYIGKDFPVVDEYSRCVLCHQELSTEARGRLTSFEEFVKGELQRDADIAESALKELTDNIDDLPTEASLTVQLDASGLSAVGDLPFIAGFFQALSSRKSKLAEFSELSELGEMPSCEVWLEKAKTLSESYGTQAQQYDADAKNDNRVELEIEQKGLKAKKWLSEQKEAIVQEVKRLKQVALVQKAKATTATTGISKKKGDIADTLITGAFIARFNDELRRLGGKKIHVELKKKKVERGRVLHCIRLKGIDSCAPRDVLSEGEHRIVSLAAFFADVASKAHASPFVFDDPISSLDQPFEEAVVLRLVELSKNRQVVVFTHRLSLLSLLEVYAEKAGVEPHINCISHEPWGAGEPGETPLMAKNTKTVNNILLNEYLKEARAAFLEEGQSAYDKKAQLICTEFRKLLERTIEKDLMSEVVIRHRRDVQTKNRLEKLAKIIPEDCEMLDAMLTKYSRNEHSQSDESPVSIPEPDELETDLTTVKVWREAFAKRVVS
jgi:energy-coupling factor transporter ATP-binding protein EcfA2